MDTTVTIITAATFAVLVLEAAKWIARAITKNPEYSFPAKLYLIAIPILSFAASPLLAWLGIAGYALPGDWQAWAKELIIVAISSVAAIFEYNYGVKPLSDYGKQRILTSRQE